MFNKTGDDSCFISTIDTKEKTPLSDKSLKGARKDRREFFSMCKPKNQLYRRTARSK